MERSSKSGQPAALSILGSDLKIEGDIVSEGDVHISGSVTGDVVARKLTLDEGASITGSVQADVAVIAGNLAGRLTATSVMLGSTAHVAADVTHVSLAIEQGAVFQGFSRHVARIEAVTDDTFRPPSRLNPPTRAEAGAD
jgi:cytoskeletal protein CcmA (bactofilin family)